MIELIYFHQPQASKAYQVIQFRAGEPWRVVDEGELLCSLEKRDGTWRERGHGNVAEEILEGIGTLIDEQNFNRLPLEIKAHWKAEVREAIAQGDHQYLVICTPSIDFERFEKVFRSYVDLLVNDPWEIRFKVYNAEMSNDFEVFVKHNAKR